MDLNRFLTYPLELFNFTLMLAVKPFADKAKTLRQYATNGYRLLGVALVVVALLLWAFGLAGWALTRLPEWAREAIRLPLDRAGLEGVPEALVLALLLALLYGIGYLVTPVRLRVGEWFANASFWVANRGLSFGEWCLEHRWISLLLAFSLVFSVSWGSYYLFEVKGRRDKLKLDFDHWLAQLERFSDSNTVSADESHSYKQVSDFWNEDFDSIVSLPDGVEHPAFVLHRMFDQLYMNQPGESWKEYLSGALPLLVEHLKGYSAEGRLMTDSEERSWALINILMGRVHVRLGHSCRGPACEKLPEAKKYFEAVINHYAPGGPPPPDGRRAASEKRHLAAAHNGLGTLYANALTSLLRDPRDPHPSLLSVCDGAAACASLALSEYAQVEGEPCSFEARRRENNTVDALARIGLNHDRVNFTDIDLAKVCEVPYVRDGAGLADCIERRLKRLVGCSSHDPFIPLIFITASQAYGVTAELRRRAGPSANVDREVAAAGNYLRLAYVLNKGASKNIKDWGLCYFRITRGDPRSRELFLNSVTSGLDHLPAPPRDYLMDLIERDAAQCQ